LAVYPLLTALSVDEAEAALHRLPLAIQEYLSGLSPMSYQKDLHTPLIVVLYNHDDQVIPVGESRSLCSALTGCTEVHFTGMLFQNLDSAKGQLPLSNNGISLLQVGAVNNGRKTFRTSIMGVRKRMNILLVR
jgi:hypothetical protein